MWKCKTGQRTMLSVIIPENNQKVGRKWKKQRKLNVT
jgi:hypothetical protein